MNDYTHNSNYYDVYHARSVYGVEPPKSPHSDESRSSSSGSEDEIQVHSPHKEENEEEEDIHSPEDESFDGRNRSSGVDLRGNSPPESSPDPAKGEKEKKKGWQKPDFMNICFFVLNLVFVLLGLALFILGLVVSEHTIDFNALTRGKLSGRLSNVDFAGVLATGSSGMMITGSITMFVGLLGTAGIVIKSPRVLYAYGGLIIVVIAGEAFSLLLTLIYRKTIFQSIKDSLLKNMRKHYDGRVNSTSLFSQGLDAAQVYFECCGIDSWRDFEDTPWYRWVNDLGDKASEDLCGNETDNTPSPSCANITAGLGSGAFSSRPPSTTTPDPDAPPRKRMLFPETCCKTTLADVLALASAGQLRLQDPDCATKNASNSNPNSAIGCFNTIKSYLFNQVIVIVSLLFTVVGLEVSAVTNAIRLAKQINKAKEKPGASKQSGKDKPVTS